MREADYSFEHKEFVNVSEDAKNLISKLLEKDIRKRFTCQQALEHSWFTQGSDINIKIDHTVINSLREYKGQSALRKEAMNVLVKMLNN